MRSQRGFSLAELLVALLVLAIVITTTLAMFVERQKRLRQATETILAYQALANEAELWRRVDFKSLDAQPLTFRSDLTLIGPMAPYAASVKIDTPRADVRNITLTIRWEAARRSASLALVRADTGGTNLW
jgi:prepilin-type N-terminal cleavage/methylation domain-containing protein